MKKQDGILILVLLTAAAVFFLGYRFWYRKNAGEVVGFLGAQADGPVPSKEGRGLLIETEKGINRLIVKDKKADVTEGSCPDKICVRQSPISQTGETIVCMPNQVIVTIEQVAGTLRH